jgi:hypothetical protein
MGGVIDRQGNEHLRETDHLPSRFLYVRSPHDSKT